MTDLDRVLDGYVLVFEEQFEGPSLDRTRWIPYYLPQWAGRDRSRAQYRIGPPLELVIEPDQEPWLPEIEGELRVSSLQTGVFAGPLGSTIGQHRAKPEYVVVEEQAEQRLVLPHYGGIELRAGWVPHPDHMVALWMIGFEDKPHRSAEICIFELFGDEVHPHGALIGMGVHPFGDPTIADDFEKIPVAFDVSEIHDYAAVWTKHDVTFYVDGEAVKYVDQSPDYPMQLMLNIYRFGTDRDSRPAEPFVVERIRIHVAVSDHGYADTVNLPRPARQ